jgi:hypothetical protein
MHAKTAETDESRGKKIKKRINKNLKSLNKTIVFVLFDRKVGWLLESTAAGAADEKRRCSQKDGYSIGTGIIWTHHHNNPGNMGGKKIVAQTIKSYTQTTHTQITTHSLNTRTQ